MDEILKRFPLIKVLIVDDSAFMRAAVQQILASDADTEVVGASPDGMDALEKVKTLRPDVVLLDVEMPVMDGFEALTRIMSESPTPVVMLSGLGQKNARLAIKCLERGAIDFIHKPSGTISYDIDILSDEIIEKVKTAAGVDVRKMALEPPAESYLSGRLRPAAGKAVVVIGASTGGPRAVEKVLSGMRRDMPSAIVVVQHMSAGFVPAFVERLRWACSLDVSIATSGAPVVPGKVLVASGDKDAAMERDAKGDRVIVAESVHGPYPSIDLAMESAASAYGEGVLGVLLTGVGSDGAKGMKAIKEAGGATIAEDSSTCVVYGMPRAAIEMGVVDRVVPLHGMAEAIMRMV